MVFIILKRENKKILPLHEFIHNNGILFAIPHHAMYNNNSEFIIQDNFEGQTNGAVGVVIRK